MFIRMISLLLVIFTKVPSSMAVGCYIWLKEICMKELSLIKDAKYDSSALPPRSFVLCPGTVTPFGAGDSFDSCDSDLPDSNIVSDASNSTIQGVTFKNATGTSVNFEIQGEAIVIQDCHFLVRYFRSLPSCQVTEVDADSISFRGQLW